MDKLLKALEGKDNRKARFRTVVALILNGEEHLFEGIINGLGSLRKEEEKRASATIRSSFPKVVPRPC